MTNFKERTKNNQTTILISVIAIILTLFIIKNRWFDGVGEGWRVTVESDGRGYYAYLPAIFIYQDQYFDFVERGEASIYGIGAAQQIYLADGQRGNKYFIGVSILLTPFFLIAWLISWLAGYALTGYNMIFFSSVAFASLFYLVIALIYLRKLLILYSIKESWIRVILIIMVFGTNVFHYAVYEPSMSHIYSFAAISGFLFYIKKFQIQNKTKHLVFAAIALALISLIRPVNGIIFLAIPFLTGSFKEFTKFIQDVFKNKKALIISMLCFSTLIFIQPFFYYTVYGNFFRWPYSNEGFDFIHPHFWDALFSYRKGLFIYTPLMFLGFLFIIPYFKKSTFASLAYIIFFTVLIWIISSWSSWSYGGSFSMRPVLEYYTLLIIPLAIGINNFTKRSSILIITFLFTSITSFCMIQTYQYENHLIRYDEMDKEKYWKVFLKTDRRLKVITYPPTVEKISIDSIESRKVILYDFETAPDSGSSNPYNTAEYYSGKHCVKIDKQSSFSPSYSSTYNSLLKDNISYLEISLMAKVYDNKNDAALIVSFEWPTGQIYRYDTYPVSLFITEDNAWQKINYSAKFPKMGNEDILKIYVWNTKESPVYIDDLRIELFSSKY